ncbi:hypothetical protein Syun_007521 [Stephania yunnanensis]|uniref:Uncharacterized protein n=1 Tax=Stephania yunnanensis TaxID=152371 RepID=A0AAP0KZN6_9MAGN
MGTKMGDLNGYRDRDGKEIGSSQEDENGNGDGDEEENISTGIPVEIPNWVSQRRIPNGYVHEESPFDRALAASPT